MTSSVTHGWNLSECFNGGDEFLRQMMRIGELFEAWACDHVAFEELEDVWPYYLEDHFGDACLHVLTPTGLPHFSREDCLRVALQLAIPIRYQDGLSLPLDIRAANTVPGSAFIEYRIRTVREDLEAHEIEPYTLNDDPIDDQFADVVLGLYGIQADGGVEHITNFSRYSDAAALAGKIAPGIDFPESPVLSGAGKTG